MSLDNLAATDFRCFQRVELDIGPRFNVIIGKNASGKTSLLEALFFLGRGRSFRASRVEELLREGAENLYVVGREKGRTIGVGWQGGRIEARVNSEAAGLAELAEALPTLVVDARAHLLIEGGPGERRRFLDWGVFHVEHGFLDAWRRYRRALGQRNRLLKQGGRTAEFEAWEAELAVAGEAVDAGRRAYLERLIPLVEGYGEAVGAPGGVSLEYRHGWNVQRTLREALGAARERERQLGSTQVGPHRADLRIELGGALASQRVSRGQQKVLAGSLLLAQAALFSQAKGRTPLILCDDLAAELDREHREAFLGQLGAIGAQVFLTAVEIDALTEAGLKEAKMFHVERGNVKEMI